VLSGNGAISGGSSSGGKAMAYACMRRHFLTPPALGTAEAPAGRPRGAQRHLLSHTKTYGAPWGATIAADGDQATP